MAWKPRPEELKVIAHEKLNLFPADLKKNDVLNDFEQIIYKAIISLTSLCIFKSLGTIVYLNGTVYYLQHLR